jgi:hypothetical protein
MCFERWLCPLAFAVLVLLVVNRMAGEYDEARAFRDFVDGSSPRELDKFLRGLRSSVDHRAVDAMCWVYAVPGCVLVKDPAKTKFCEEMRQLCSKYVENDFN